MELRAAAIGPDHRDDCANPKVHGSPFETLSHSVLIGTSIERLNRESTPLRVV